MNLLQEHFDIAVETPDGIEKLRKLILTLAMQGKLVPQDPNDKPASELLKEIEAEKKRLVKEGKIREQKQLAPIKEEDMPYRLPRGWEWVRLGEIARHNSGKTLDSGRNKGEYRDYITTSNLYWGYFVLENLRQMPIKKEELEKCSATKGDLLVCEGGEAGRASVWSYDTDICFQNHIHRVRFYNEIDPYYAYRFFEKINATGEINKFRKGVAISSISSKSLGSIVFPLSPLQEQKRIVSKIDQLMSLCDKLEAQRNERNRKREEILDAVLA
ncbi:MAG: restriction endonuclease subunit S, partial [Bacteroidetes bacterium]|nr:restriction endonuclease subunit S [Bacteroidota bacterium]